MVEDSYIARYQASRNVEDARRNLDRAQVRYELATTSAIIDHNLSRAGIAHLAGRSVSTIDRWLATERERRQLLDPQLPGTETDLP